MHGQVSESLPATCLVAATLLGCPPDLPSSATACPAAPAQLSRCLLAYLNQLSRARTSPSTVLLAPAEQASLGPPQAPPDLTPDGRAAPPSRHPLPPTTAFFLASPQVV